MNPDRYSRQLLFSGIGPAGQEMLGRSGVIIIGCGALGAMQAEMMARAGVGRLRLVDRDFVELSNLHRQVMYAEPDAASRLPKAVAAARRIGLINSEVNVEPLVKDVNHTNIEDLIADVDLILDGTDNFETRYLINDAALKARKPWIYGAAVGAHGLQMTIRPGFTPCLRCLFPEMPAPGTSPTCDTAGVILPIIATVVGWQIAEALKILTGQPDRLHGALLQFDLWENRQTRLRLSQFDAPHPCPACVDGRYDFLEVQSGQMVTALCGRQTIQITPPVNNLIDLSKLALQLRNVGEVSYNAYLLKFRTGEFELTVFPDARCLVRGTDDPMVARSLYARYLGA
ncbi:MAG: thiazole biosynthesis adenylyltransferase ThiF [Acidobacteria bacterium]|nr:thiazole biosynthesis adenylyltransferase ThiF [Acidobacteriota bacterium]